MKNNIPYSVNFWRGKTLANRLFQSFVKENVGKFIIANISSLLNLEFCWVKYWQIMFICRICQSFPLPKFALYGNLRQCHYS